jgi:intraflagellar transport protein 80
LAIFGLYFNFSWAEIFQTFLFQGTNIHNFVWNDTYNMLAGISDGRFTVWYYPSVAYVDKNLLQKTIFQKDANEYGRNVSITGFLGNHVTMRGSDGSAIHAGISPYATVLHSFLAANKWEDALKLCRFVKVNCVFDCRSLSRSQRKIGVFL